LLSEADRKASLWPRGRVLGEGEHGAMAKFLEQEG
jgi:hypothetical protein